MQCDRAVAPRARRYQSQTTARLFRRKLALLVARRHAFALRRYPDLQKVRRLVRRRVKLAVRDARARAHALHLAGSYDGRVAHAVAVLKRAGDDVRDDLHVAVRVRREARGGRDAVFVYDEEVAEARPARVVVAVEGERVSAVEPVRARPPALFGGPSSYHYITPLIGRRFRTSVRQRSTSSSPRPARRTVLWDD